MFSYKHNLQKHFNYKFHVCNNGLRRVPQHNGWELLKQGKNGHKEKGNNYVVWITRITKTTATRITSIETMF